MSPDVLVIGSGIIGSLMAQQILEQRPGATVTIIDAGLSAGSVAGHHLHDTPDTGEREQYSERAAAGNQAVYVGAPSAEQSGDELATGLHKLNVFGHQAEQFPGAALSWNVGGMGIHWAAATPWPYGPEVVDFLPADEWAQDLATARRLWHVDPDPYPATAAGAAVVQLLEDEFGPDCDDARHVQSMPMATTVREDGRLARTGADAVFPELATILRPGLLATRLLHQDGKVTGARTKDVRTGEESEILASTVVVCADPFRTPQLLWASAIRPEALGRYLNEHAFVSGRVEVDLERIGNPPMPVPPPGEWATAATWLPASGERQPFHGQIVQSPTDDGGYAVILALYVPTEVRAENRVEFSDDETDLGGMPRMTVHFGYSERDLDLISQAQARQAAACNRLGEFLPERDSQVLPAGSSLHYTGTVRMGPADDGTSVCDPDGRVWGFENLYLAGNGVVPTALSANAALTGAVLAVRTARAVATA